MDDPTDLEKEYQPTTFVAKERVYSLPCDWEHVCRSASGSALLNMLGAIRLERDAMWKLLRTMHPFTAAGWLEASHRLRVEGMKAAGQDVKAEDVARVPTQNWEWLQWLLRNGIDQSGRVAEALENKDYGEVELSQIGFLWLQDILECFERDYQRTKEKMAQG